jgi:hypothetical protein
MGRRIRNAAIWMGLVMVIGVQAARAAGGFSPPAFSPGTWTGKVTETGNLAVGQIAGTVSGSWKFSFRISRRGTVADGSITGRRYRGVGAHRLGRRKQHWHDPVAGLFGTCDRDRNAP